MDGLIGGCVRVSGGCLGCRWERGRCSGFGFAVSLLACSRALHQLTLARATQIHHVADWQTDIGERKGRECVTVLVFFEDVGELTHSAFPVFVLM